MALYQARQMDHVRHTNEWVGLIVVLAALLFVGAVLEAGVLRDWFRPVSRLRILLPQSGVGGLAVGADIDVLGIRAGKVTRVVLNPNQIYAEADIDQQAEAFIRRDSEAVIRRSFGIVGAAYVDITRGAGAPLLPKKKPGWGLIKACPKRFRTMPAISRFASKPAMPNIFTICRLI